jgi:ketosteroid isomerase-like protein
LALETAWNHAIEAKDAKAIEMILADSMVAVESDASLSTKSQYLAGIKAPDFQPSQAVNEKNDVHVYGDTAVAVGIFRIKEVDKGKTVIHRERTVDTWMKLNGTWKCVAAVAVRMPTGKSKDE